MRLRVRFLAFTALVSAQAVSGQGNPLRLHSPAISPDGQKVAGGRIHAVECLHGSRQ
jgi:hypothetical protein